MEITEVRIKLMEEPGERLKAFCSVTFDDAFVVRDLKIIEGGSGPFVAMPSRKLTAHCSHCSCKNHLRATFCNQCGKQLHDQQAIKDEDGREKLYADIAHPINSICREMIQTRVVEAFQEEVTKAQEPGYYPSYDELDQAEPDNLPVEEEKTSPETVEPTQVQLAEKPRGPHRIPPHHDSLIEGERKDEFGAGIFE